MRRDKPEINVNDVDNDLIDSDNKEEQLDHQQEINQNYIHQINQ